MAKIVLKTGEILELPFNEAVEFITLHSDEIQLQQNTRMRLPLRRKK